MSQVLHISGSLQRGDFTLDVQLDLDLAQPLGIQGVTGAGKTTLLRVIAGLEPAFSGTVRWGDEIWHDPSRGVEVPTFRRGLGVVMQNHPLLPDRTVHDSLIFAIRRGASCESGLSLDDVVNGLQLNDVQSQSVETLSGGERQRVALAQALLVRPRLLLLDEPLSANDSSRRQQIVERLRTWISALGLPTIYVSHAPEELARLSEHLLLLESGSVIRRGDTRALLVKGLKGMGVDAEAQADVGAVARVVRRDLQENTVTIAWDTTQRVLDIDRLPEGSQLWVRPADTSAHNSGPLDAPLQPESSEDERQPAERGQSQRLSGDEPNE